MTFSSSFVAVAFRKNFLQMHKWCCIIFALSGPFFRKVIDAENTEGNILLADVCAFRHFERVLPAAVQSANCQFDSREKWYVDASAIGTYRRPNLFVALKHLQSALCIVWTVVVIDRLHHARRPFWTQQSHWWTFMKNGEYSTYSYLQLLYYFMELQFMVGQHEFGWPERSESCVSVRLCLKDTCHLLTLVSFPTEQRANKYYQTIALLEVHLNQHTKFRFTWITVSCKQMIWCSADSDM